MPTQRDVANHADVSSASVSRFLNDPESVRPAIAERIKSAIEALNYQIDYSAQTLKTGRFHNVGLLAPAIGPFYWEIFYALQSGLSDHGYATIMYFTRNVDPHAHSWQGETLPFFRKRQLDGAFFFPLLNPTDDALLGQFSRWPCPCMVLDRHLQPSKGDPDLPQLWLDNYHVGYEAADAFLVRGHRKFLFLWGSFDSMAAHERFNGFQTRLAEAGIILEDERQLDGWYQSSRVYGLISGNFATLPEFTAVFACNDAMAAGCMKALEEHGRHCPGDYSIIGVDDNLDFSPYMGTGLTSFRQPLQEFGARAAETMVDLIEGRVPRTDHEPLRSTLIIRESLGALGGVG